MVMPGTHRNHDVQKPQEVSFRLDENSCSASYGLTKCGELSIDNVNNSVQITEGNTKYNGTILYNYYYNYYYHKVLCM